LNEKIEFEIATWRLSWAENKATLIFALFYYTHQLCGEKGIRNNPKLPTQTWALLGTKTWALQKHGPCWAQLTLFIFYLFHCHCCCCHSSSAISTSIFFFKKG
jgi:hypothetical protein